MEWKPSVQIKKGPVVNGANTVINTWAQREKLKGESTSEWRNVYTCLTVGWLKQCFSMKGTTVGRAAQFLIVLTVLCMVK